MTACSYRAGPSAPEQEFLRSYSSRSKGGRPRMYEGGGDDVNVRGEVIYDSGYVNL